jgi:hypothetical protein
MEFFSDPLPHTRNLELKLHLHPDLVVDARRGVEGLLAGESDAAAVEVLAVGDVVGDSPGADGAVTDAGAEVEDEVIGQEVAVVLEVVDEIAGSDVMGAAGEEEPLDDGDLDAEQAFVLGGDGKRVPLMGPVLDGRLDEGVGGVEDDRLGDGAAGGDLDALVSDAGTFSLTPKPTPPGGGT